MKKILSVLFVSLAFSTSACSHPYYGPPVYPAPSISTCYNINGYNAWGNAYTGPVCENVYSSYNQYNYREDYTPYIVGGALGLGLGALLFNQRHQRFDRGYRGYRGGRGHYRH